MKRSIYSLPLVLLIACAVQAETKFIQVRENDSGKVISLDTATVRYESENQIVDLIGVIHIGDKSYYQALNKDFKEYDVVLFELVAPPGTKPPNPKTGKRKEGILAMIQNMMKDALQLEHQLKIVNYEAENFVHADLSFPQMIKIAKSRGEDKLTLGLGITRDLMLSMNRMKANPPKGQELPDINPLAIFLGDRGEGKKLKRFFALSLRDPKASGVGKTIEASLIVDRNAACLKVLKEQIALDKKKIAIFYGAAHMPDFEKRLLVDYGMKKTSHKWLKAWDLAE